MSKFANVDIAMVALILEQEENEEKTRQIKRRKWVHKAWKNRETEGEFATLYKELVDDATKFYQYFRMSESCFNILLSKIKIHLQKKDTFWRKSVTPRERLAVCLRYLSTGDSLRTISFSYRLGHSTVYEIVITTCKIIVENLLAETMPKPTTNMWKNIAEEFNTIWNFPNCLGALDGKHITMQCPPNSGSLFLNYKKTFSVVLLALVDANYKFITVDVGAYGKNSDGGILANSNLGKMLHQGRLSVPESAPLPGTVTSSPYVIVADEAFPLKTYLMRPYPGKNMDNDKRIFNYRICRVRRVVENAFGILSQKFRIYNRRIQAKPKNVDNIILTTCILHNFIKMHDADESHIVEMRDNVEEIRLQNLPMQGGNATTDAFNVRDIFKNYFTSVHGAIPWQESKIN